MLFNIIRLLRACAHVTDSLTVSYHVPNSSLFAHQPLIYLYQGRERNSIDTGDEMFAGNEVGGITRNIYLFIFNYNENEC